VSKFINKNFYSTNSKIVMKGLEKFLKF